MEILTLPAASYASFRAGMTEPLESVKEQVKHVIKQLLHQPFPAEWWESILLPARVNRYREGILDEILGEGEYFFGMQERGKIAFYSYDEIEWECTQDENIPEIEEQKKIYDFRNNFV